MGDFKVLFVARRSTELFHRNRFYYVKPDYYQPEVTFRHLKGSEIFKAKKVKNLVDPEKQKRQKMSPNLSPRALQNLQIKTQQKKKRKSLKLSFKLEVAKTRRKILKSRKKEMTLDL